MKKYDIVCPNSNMPTVRVMAEGICVDQSTITLYKGREKVAVVPITMLVYESLIQD